MFTDRRPCSCQGNNPDCFRCNGTGMIPDQAKDSDSHSEIYNLTAMLNLKRKSNNSNSEIIANNQDQKIKTNIKSNISKESVSKFIMCPLCSVGFSSKDLITHISTLHKKRIKSNRYYINYLPDFIKHEIDSILNNESPKKTTIAKDIPAGIGMLVTCEYCGITLSRARLESHKNNIHKDILKSINHPDKKTIVADKRKKGKPVITPKKQ